MRRGRPTDRRSRTARIATATSTSGRSRSAMCSRLDSRLHPRTTGSPHGRRMGSMWLPIGTRRRRHCSSCPRRAETNGESRISAIGRDGRLASGDDPVFELEHRPLEAICRARRRRTASPGARAISRRVCVVSRGVASGRSSNFRITARTGATACSFWTVALDGTSPVRSPVSADVAIRLKKTGVNLTEFSLVAAGGRAVLRGTIRGSRQYLAHRRRPAIDGMA